MAVPASRGASIRIQRSEYSMNHKDTIDGKIVRLLHPLGRPHFNIGVYGEIHLHISRFVDVVWGQLKESFNRYLT